MKVITLKYLKINIFTLMLAILIVGACGTKTDCSQVPKRVIKKPVYTNEIDSFSYTGTETISFIHWIDNSLTDTLFLQGTGAIMHEEEFTNPCQDCECPDPTEVSQTYSMNYIINPAQYNMTITLTGGYIYDHYPYLSNTLLTVMFDGYQFECYLAELNNINSTSYKDSITIDGIIYYDCMVVYRDKLSKDNFMIFSYKEGIKYIKGGDERFRTY